MEKTRKVIGLPRCPFCNSRYSDMQINQIGSEEIFVKCKCDKCHKEYMETFELTEQVWEVT